MVEQILPHTAAATWSGFIYQGRVALYHVLKLLVEKSEDDINELHLQLDSLEDFAIIRYNENRAIIPLSLHQVKAVKSDMYSTYKDDFKQLEKKATDTEIENIEAYFHLSTKNALPNNEIEASHPKLKIYCYDNDDGFCSLNEIDDKIRVQIGHVLQKYGIVGYQNENNIQILYNVLEGKIADRIAFIHSLNHGAMPIREAAYENPICLSEFLKETRNDISVIIQDEIYFESVVKRDLNRYYQDFCLNCDEPQLSENSKVKMDNYLYFFNSLNSNDFKTFLQSIRPHRKISYRNLQEYGDCLNDDEMKDAFFQILLAIKGSNCGIGWTCLEGKHYYPTSINYSNSDINKKRISERVLKTALSTMVDVPFNSDYLITSECNVDSIEAYANNVSHINGNIVNVDEDETNKITQWRKISLIDLETAKNKLND